MHVCRIVSVVNLVEGSQHNNYLKWVGRFDGATMRHECECRLDCWN